MYQSHRISILPPIALQSPSIIVTHDTRQGRKRCAFGRFHFYYHQPTSVLIPVKDVKHRRCCLFTFIGIHSRPLPLSSSHCMLRQLGMRRIINHFLGPTNTLWSFHELESLRDSRTRKWINKWSALFPWSNHTWYIIYLRGKEFLCCAVCVNNLLTIFYLMQSNRKLKTGLTTETSFIC